MLDAQARNVLANLPKNAGARDVALADIFPDKLATPKPLRRQ